MTKFLTHLDVVGLGALNVDYIASASSLTERMADRVTESAARFERNVEGRTTEDVILSVIQQLGTSSLQTALGGSAWNTVFALGQLEVGLRLGYVGVLGEVGMLGLSFMHQMDLLGIDRQWVSKQVNRPSGMCLSYIDDGERTLLTCPGANLEMANHLNTNRKVIARYLASSRYVHVTSLLDSDGPAAQLAVLADAKSLNPGMQITFDPGYDWAVNPTESILGILALADHIFVNFREFKSLGNYRHGQLDIDVARAMLTRCSNGATIFVTKRYDFVEVFRAGGKDLHAEQFHLTLPPNSGTALEDATGAGDIFSAAVIAALASRKIQVELGSLLGLSLARHKLQGLKPPALTGGFLQLGEKVVGRSAHPMGIFLSHDGSPYWREVRRFLEDDCGVDVYDLEHSAPGSAVADTMRIILKKCSFAVCILSVDSTMPIGLGRANQDIVHQAGLFHGRYGFGRVAMLVEEGCEIFSNAAGLIRLPFTHGRVDATFLEVERILIREGLIGGGAAK